MLRTLKSNLKHQLNKAGLDVRRVDSIPFGTSYGTDLKYLLNGEKLKTVFDVGANTGQTSLCLLQQYPDASIFAFEPVPTTYQKLKSNLSRYHSRVSLHNIALGNTIGELPMTITENSLLSTCRLSSQSGRNNSQTVMVNADTIDSFCQENEISHIHFLKTDTEGFDLNVLRGAEDLLRNQSIDFILSECRFFNRRETEPPGDFIDLLMYLQAFNYNFVTLYTEAVDDLGFVFGNVLFCSTASKKAQRCAFSPFGDPINWYDSD